MHQHVLSFEMPAAHAREKYASARLWLLGRLQQGPVATIELRREPWPASMNPAQRVAELRADGHDIRTIRRGKSAFYALFAGGVMFGRLPDEAAA